jgi:hypothetical protein
MKDTTLIKDKDLAYEVYLVSKKLYFNMSTLLTGDGILNLLVKSGEPVI